MNELFNRVTRGVYAPLPSQYSEEFHHLIRNLLQVSPRQRPSCDEILRFPSIARRLRSRASSRGNESSAALLGTIELPRNISLLSNKLPVPNYERRKPSSRSSEPIAIRREMIVEKPPTHMSPTHLKSNLRDAGRALMLRQPSRETPSRVIPSRESRPPIMPPRDGRPPQGPSGNLRPAPSRDLQPPAYREPEPPISRRPMITGNREYGSFLQHERDPLKLPPMPRPVYHRPSRDYPDTLSNRISSIRAQYDKPEASSSRRQLVRPSIAPGWWG